MKNFMTFLTGLLLFTGCIDYSSTIKLNSDGSGTVEETVLMSKMFSQMMNSFAQSFGGDSAKTENSFDIFDEEKLKQEAENMGEGVQYVKGEKVIVDGNEGYTAFYKFDDISKLKISDSPDDKVPSDNMIMENELTDEDKYIKFNFRKGDDSVLEVLFPEEEKDEEAEKEEADTLGLGGEINDEMMAEQMKMLMKDFKISMKMEINGDISETNASHRKGNMITFFEMDFEKLLDFPEKFDELQKTEPESITEAIELLKNIPGFKIEIKDEIFVKFN